MKGVRTGNGGRSLAGELAERPPDMWGLIKPQANKHLATLSQEIVKISQKGDWRVKMTCKVAVRFD